MSLNRPKCLFTVALLGAFALCSYTCSAQTIPPGVGSRHYETKLRTKSGAARNPKYIELHKDKMDLCSKLSDRKALTTFGAPKTIALRAVCSMDTHLYTHEQIGAGIDFIKAHIEDGYSYADAIQAINALGSPGPSQPAEALVKAAINAQPQIDNVNCNAIYNTDTKQFDYIFGNFLPTSRHSCGQTPVLNFFNLTKSATFGNTVQYLYNPKVGANQVSSDLLTAVFPQGFQVVLAGTGTIPTGQSSSQGSSNPPAAQTTSDPVALAVQKIESGGDFNLRFNLPLLSTPPGNTAWATYLQPSVGFVLGTTTSQTNAGGAQVAVSSSNQYVISLPLESYFQTSSITGDNSNGLATATLFADLRYGGNILSPQFQQTLGIPNRIFQLGQASAGIDFAGSFRIGFQYFFGGPNQAYVLANSSGQTTNVNSAIKGFHIVFTYSPKKTS